MVIGDKDRWDVWGDNHWHARRTFCQKTWSSRPSTMVRRIPLGFRPLGRLRRLLYRFQQTGMPSTPETQLSCASPRLSLAYWRAWSSAWLAWALTLAQWCDKQRHQVFPTHEDELLLEASTSKASPMIIDISGSIRELRKKKETRSELRLDQKYDRRKIQKRNFKSLTRMSYLKKSARQHCPYNFVSRRMLRVTI